MNPITAKLVPEAVPGDENGPTEPFPLRGKLVNIGRGAQNDVILESLQVSRRHAVFSRDSRTGKWSIRDVSTNGICLNSLRLPQHQDRILGHQDLIQFIPMPIGHTGQLMYRFLYINNDEVIVDEDEDNESLLSVKSPGEEPVVIEERKGCKRKLELNTTPQSQTKRHPEVIQLSDEEDFNTPSENDKPLSAFSQNDLEEEVKLLRGRLARSKEQHKKQLEAMEALKAQAADKKRLEEELQIAREEAVNFGGRVNGLLEGELSCSICSEIFVDARVTTCGHTFCAFCIREWLRKKPDCPICRKHVRGTSRHVEIDNFVEKTHLLLPTEIQSRRSSFLAERKIQEQQQPSSAQHVGFVGSLHAINQFVMAGAGHPYQHQHPPVPARRSGRRGHRDRLAALAATAAAVAASSSAQHQNVQIQHGVIDLSVSQ